MPADLNMFPHPMTDRRGSFNNTIADRITLSKKTYQPRQMTIASAVAGKQYTGDIGNAYREAEAAETEEPEEPVVSGQ